MTAKADPGKTSRACLAAFFCSAGILHFVLTPSYLAIMPPYLPWHGALVLLSGAGEIAGGLGILFPRLRRCAGLGLCALLLAVFPANFQMLFNAIAAHESAAVITLLVARLPLQPLMMFWIWRLTQPGARPHS